jgi:hypothetical protein
LTRRVVRGDSAGAMLRVLPTRDLKAAPFKELASRVDPFGEA